MFPKRSTRSHPCCYGGWVRSTRGSRVRARQFGVPTGRAGPGDRRGLALCSGGSDDPVAHTTITTQGGLISVDLRVNDQIRAREVRLVGPEGEQVGIVPLERALQLAADVDLDLVEVAPMARPPVCKLMDFGKFKYESALKAREARRNQQQTVNKEMKLRPKIDSHDYETKKGHVVRFLQAGNKVKVTIMFRGREQSRPELGLRLLRRLSDEVAELGFVEAAPKQDGRNMTMVLAPHRGAPHRAKGARVPGPAQERDQVNRRGAEQPQEQPQGQPQG
jgi:translation initiation factor IF-3